MNHVGLHAYRLMENPEEKRFAEMWKKYNHTGGTLAYILNLNNQREEPPDHDCVVAATVIQWLGSPVGQGFLQELGYTRKK